LPRKSRSRASILVVPKAMKRRRLGSGFGAMPRSTAIAVERQDVPPRFRHHKRVAGEPGMRAAP
jgi:hypothetical protein